MKQTIVILSLMALTESAIAVFGQTVTLLGANKSLFFEQTDSSSTRLRFAEFLGFIGGENLTTNYPAGPRTISPPGGSAGTFQFEQDLWYFYASFITKEVLDQAFPNGAYSFRVADRAVSLNMVADAYPVVPISSADAGDWISGKLRLNTAQATAGFRLYSATSIANGGGRFSLKGVNRDFTLNLRAAPGQKSFVADLAPGALQAGGEYLVEVLFNHYAYATSAAAIETGADAVGIYSVTTQFTIEVIPPNVPRPELSLTYTLDQNGMIVPALHWTSPSTQAWQVQHSDDLAQWVSIGAPVPSVIGANSHVLTPLASSTRFFQLKLP